MLVQNLRRWTNIETSLFQRVVFGGKPFIYMYVIMVITQLVVRKTSEKHIDRQERSTCHCRLHESRRVENIGFHYPLMMIFLSRQVIFKGKFLLCAIMTVDQTILFSYVVTRVCSLKIILTASRAEIAQFSELSIYGSKRVP